MKLLYAIAARDENAIAEAISAGEHPLSKMEMAVQMRGHAVDTLLSFVPHEDVEYVRCTMRHLYLINRYPAALASLTKWLTNVDNLAKGREEA